MPNGGLICCEYCTYNRLTRGKCDVFGIETGPSILCRMFRTPGQSHQEARMRYPILKELEPGAVYAINNTGGYSANDDPQPIYKIKPIKKSKF